MGNDVFEQKVQKVIDGWTSGSGSGSTVGLSGDEMKNAESLMRARAEEVVSGLGDPLGYPDPRGYVERVVDDFLEPALANWRI